MNTDTRTHRYTALQAAQWHGRKVWTTNNVKGTVIRAYPSGDGTRVVLSVWVGTYAITSDSEHVTVMK